MKTAFIASMFILGLGSAIADDYASLRQLYTDIRTLAAQDLSCDSDSNCRAIALGSRACGGPNGYTFTSNKNQNYSAITQMASELAQREHEYNVENRVISICSMAMPPRLECKEQVCAVSSNF